MFWVRATKIDLIRSGFCRHQRERDESSSSAWYAINTPLVCCSHDDQRESSQDFGNREQQHQQRPSIETCARGARNAIAVSCVWNRGVGSTAAVQMHGLAKPCFPENILGAAKVVEIVWLTRTTFQAVLTSSIWKLDL